MSLLKQLFLAICLFLLLAFAGSFFVGLENSRAQMLAQLRAHAQDAATALGVSLTPHIDDAAMLELMVSSIFDSGYYTSIRLVDLHSGQVLVERREAADEHPVPAWFAWLAALPPQQGEALIMRGWAQAAQVQVVSQPRFALQRLWQSALGSLAWLALCGLASATLGGWLLRRQLRPLDAMAAQAEAISRRQFVVQEPVPRTPELRRVVMAMNLMVGKLEGLFSAEAARADLLQEEAFRDSLTGLANRRLLETRLANDLLQADQNSPGHLVMLRLKHLTGLNQRLGGQATDALLCAVADLLRRLLQDPARADWLAARNRGGEFALLAPVTTAADARHLLSHLSDALGPLYHTGASDCQPVGYLAAVPYHPGQAPQALWLHLDQALAEAQAHPAVPWVLAPHSEHHTGANAHEWRSWLEHTLEQRQLNLFFQPVVHCAPGRALLHHKVLARLRDPAGQMVAAGHFLPWVERLGWAGRFDQIMLDHVLDHLAVRPRPLALSVSADTLSDPGWRQALLDRLERATALGQWLTLEADERKLPSYDELQALSLAIRERGFHFAIQHFGGQFSQIGHLTRLGLAWLKVEGTYIRGIDWQSDKCLFIEAMLRATHSIDLPLIAEMVETEGEFQVLHELGMQGAMGRWIGPPEGGPLA
ncbi:EAL domain-containing protein [Pseudomonas typographi]|uniref:EAL domain-containing protein n=1 Tax=Pseudomonas typographi TaxID=2715964 RepID=A0ABR7Z917_9PSED|nr:EAL domain-containing protein [Pseudomonas typographi]MBD1554957.1 EAL domain-containing protein [Pseudomonas typographi]MBD1590012.1 EAL domain-containing protein [Pseudomonas typographi]MBD1602044.1 EAL domain-containing protein [Pseudomonas typographi]